jgi:hypothetical protein
MELGAYSLQVFTSLVVILGAAFVALICDFLKGNNEQLRELTIELKVRREEEHKRVQLMMPHTLTEAPVAAGKSEHAPRSLAVPRERKRTAAPEALAAMERGEQLAGDVRNGSRGKLVGVNRVIHARRQPQWWKRCSRRAPPE